MYSLELSMQLYMFCSSFAFCGNLFCASALPWLKPRLIAFISLVWDQYCRDTHRNTHTQSQTECVHTTHVIAHGTQCARSKLICTDQNETSGIDIVRFWCDVGTIEHSGFSVGNKHLNTFKSKKYNVAHF